MLNKMVHFEFHCKLFIKKSLSDIEGHYSSLKPFHAPFVWKGDVAHINYGMFTHESEVFGL